MKKLNIILVILILFLTFTLIGNCWVAGYDQRIKLTIDNTKIDATLTDFPVTAFFTVTQAEEIFAEFDADEDFDRGQFALEDDTLLYAEKELFDDSESLAIYHFKVPSISSSEGTDIYFYYDNDAGHNTTYIGAINTVAGAAVWDTNYKAVYHMVDDNGNVDDSTSNNNDGTKAGVGEPNEVSGKIGLAQNFDGNNDYIGIGDIGVTEDWTVEFWADLANTNQTLYYPIGLSGKNGIFLAYTNDNWGMYDGSGIVWGSSVSIDTWYHFAVTKSGTTYSIYLDGSFEDDGTLVDIDITGLNIGKRSDNFGFFDGIIDESRISDTDRSTAWLKGTYNSGMDTLLTYGSEETSEVEPTYNYYGHFIK